MEQRLFFFLLRRWCLKREDSISLPNGVVCLLPSLPYDVQVKSNTTLRKSAKQIKQILDKLTKGGNTDD